MVIISKVLSYQKWNSLKTLPFTVSTLSRKLICWVPLLKVTYFHLISWCWNFAEKHSLCRIFSGNSAETVPLGKTSTPENSMKLYFTQCILRENWSQELCARLKVMVCAVWQKGAVWQKLNSLNVKVAII